MDTAPPATADIDSVCTGIETGEIGLADGHVALVHEDDGTRVVRHLDVQATTRSCVQLRANLFHQLKCLWTIVASADFTVREEPDEVAHDPRDLFCLAQTVVGERQSDVGTEDDVAQLLLLGYGGGCSGERGQRAIEFLDGLVELTLLKCAETMLDLRPQLVRCGEVKKAARNRVGGRDPIGESSFIETAKRDKLSLDARTLGRGSIAPHLRLQDDRLSRGNAVWTEHREGGTGGDPPPPYANHSSLKV